MLCMGAANMALGVAKTVRELARRRAELVCVAIAVCVAFGATFPALAEADEEELEKRITYFYKNPDLDALPDLVSKLYGAGMMSGKAAAPMMGFLAPLFERHPDRIDAIIGGPYPRDAQRVFAYALIFVGMNQKAAAYMQEKGWPKDTVEGFAGAHRSLIESPIIRAAELDVLWGASFSSGDKRYPSRIIDVVAKSLASGKFDVEDMDYVGNPRNLHQSDSAELARITGRYEEEDLDELMMNGSALWSLGSNAKRHPFVMEAVQERITATPDSDLAYLLRKAVSR